MYLSLFDVLHGFTYRTKIEITYRFNILYYYFLTYIYLLTFNLFLGSGSSGCTPVRVQIPASAPLNNHGAGHCNGIPFFLRKSVSVDLFYA